MPTEGTPRPALAVYGTDGAAIREMIKKPMPPSQIRPHSATCPYWGRAERGMECAQEHARTVGRTFSARSTRAPDASMPEAAIEAAPAWGGRIS